MDKEFEREFCQALCDNAEQDSLITEEFERELVENSNVEPHMMWPNSKHLVIHSMSGFVYDIPASEFDPSEFIEGSDNMKMVFLQNLGQYSTYIQQKLQGIDDVEYSAKLIESMEDYMSSIGIDVTKYDTVYPDIRNHPDLYIPMLFMEISNSTNAYISFVTAVRNNIGLIDHDGCGCCEYETTGQMFCTQLCDCGTNGHTCVCEHNCDQCPDDHDCDTCDEKNVCIRKHPITTEEE